MTTLEKLAAKHKDWLRTVKSFGCPQEIAEDVVQEMYIRINRLIKQEGLDINYNKTEINYFYI